MLQLTKKQSAASINNLIQDILAPACSSKEIDKTFAQDLRVILKAIKYIDNPATQQQILEFYLSALIARYAESKIANLIENDLQKAFHYGREPKRTGRQAG